MIWLNGYSLPQRNTFGELHVVDIQMNSIVCIRLKYGANIVKLFKSGALDIRKEHPLELPFVHETELGPLLLRVIEPDFLAEGRIAVFYLFQFGVGSLKFL